MNDLPQSNMDGLAFDLDQWRQTTAAAIERDRLAHEASQRQQAAQKIKEIAKGFPNEKAGL